MLEMLEMLEMRLALPEIARSPQAGVARRLGERTFPFAARTLHVVECGYLLARPRCLPHRVSFWREA